MQGNSVVRFVRQMRRELDRLTTLQLALILFVFSLFMIYPLLSIIGGAFWDDGFTAQNMKAVFDDPELWRSPGQWDMTFYKNTERVLIIGLTDCGAIINSFLIAIFTTLFSTIIGVTLAYVMYKYEFPGKTIFKALILVPLIAPPFVGALGVREFISHNGIINQILFEQLHILPKPIWITGLPAIILVETLHFYTLVYLNAHSSFVNIDPSLEEQAENMGARGFFKFRSVTLPLAMPGIEAGAILTFILSLEDLGTPIIFSQGAYSYPARHTITLYILNNWAPQYIGQYNYKVMALCVLLLAIALACFVIIRKYISLRKYAMMSKGGTWQPVTLRASRRQVALIIGFIVVLLGFALMPHIGIFKLSFTKGGLGGLTLDNYRYMFSNVHMYTPIKNSLIYSFVSVILIIIVGTMAAYIIARKKIPGLLALDMLVTMPLAIPGIVLGIGLFVVFYGTPFFNPTNPAFVIIAAYVIRKIPFAVRAAYAGLQQTHEALEEASLNVGASKVRTLLRITLPLISMSIVAGAMLSFVYVISEVSTSILLGATNPEMAPITWKIKELFFHADFNDAAALGVLLMGIQTVTIVAANYLLKNRAEVMTGL
ncbi:MAG: iron ABC transporter permease [Candidatus Methanofastidiosa archaeon]|nr:iron ABC transporter permease [Candidatus Methanofastidiosa archaeon]